MSAASAATAVGELVAVGRYRLEAELARGAMGVVYRAVDTATGTSVALKRLTGQGERMAQMFEREYHTLASLKHPRIIEVYDYGIDASGPYYTMELLDGADLRDLAPLDYRKACAYLRDVASSLGLIHARRLLHRDLSPRNVRVTSDDRAKLIDFGGLSGFGIPEVVVGTPPCVPPEALHHAALDQRADLYALGALAYWLLTGRHAYHARELAALPEVWRQTLPRPSEVAAASGADVPPIPGALDDLVMSLLTLNPLGRPASAAAVIDRLVEIGELDRQQDDSAAASYLLGAPSVGRERERERLRKRLTAAIEGEGACVVVEAAEGMGSTRLLSELTVEAQLAGALPLLVDAKIERGAYGVVHSMLAKIIDAARDDAVAAAAGHEAVLARFSPELQAALGVQPEETDYTATPGELRKRVQDALADFIFALSKLRPLVLAVDNAQRVDDGSAALLTTLAGSAGKHGLLVAAVIKPGEIESAPAAARALRTIGATMVLRGLDREQVHELVRGLFGDVQNTARLADWVHRFTGGNPQAAVDLAEHLVQHRVVRYIQGSWVLPQELSTDDLPRSLDQLLERRLARLPADARHLAEALSVHRGELSLPRCLAVAELEGIASPYEALDALARENVLVSAGGAYHFAHDSLRSALVSALDGERQRRMHRGMGALIARDLDDDDTNALLDAGWHLLHGGDERRGADLLARAGLRLTYAVDEAHSAVPALRAALEVYTREGAPDAKLLTLLTPLAMSAYYSDRRLADEFGEQALRVFSRHLGLGWVRRLRPFLGRHLSLYLVLGVVGGRYLLRHGPRGIGNLVETITHFIACTAALTGVATICLDFETARRRAETIEPLTALGDEHGASLAYRFATHLSWIPLERVTEVIEGCEPLAERLRDPRPVRDMHPDSRAMIFGGVLYAVGAMECFRDGDAALRLADELEAVGLKLYEMVADQIRTSYHALRGEVMLADTYRQRVEMHAVQAGSGWQAEVWVPASMIMVYVLTLDTIGLKRTSEQLDRLSREIPSLELNARLARAEYLHLKGDHEGAFELTGPILERTRDRDFMGRTFAIGNHARALNQLGRHAEVVELLSPYVGGLSDADQRVVALYVNIQRELAHAHAGLGQFEEAYALLDDLLVRHEGSEHRLLQGNLHASATTVALRAREVPRALEHLSHMEHWFRPTENPALIAQCEHMRREVKRLVDDVAPQDAPVLGQVDTASEDALATARSLLSQCQGGDQRAQFALQMLLNHVRGRVGFLFSYESGGLRLLAPQHGDEPPAGLLARIRADIDGETAADEVTVVTESPARASLPPPPLAEVDRRDFRTFVLSIQLEDRVRVVGGVAVQVDDRPLNPPQQGFLQTVARSLFESGDAGNTVIRTR